MEKLLVFSSIVFILQDASGLSPQMVSRVEQLTPARYSKYSHMTNYGFEYDVAL